MTACNERYDSEEWERSPSNPWPELISAILSVNNFPIAKTFALWERLNSNGLFNPINYTRWSRDDIGRRLVASGYDRGPMMTDLFAARLASVKYLVEDIDLSQSVLLYGSPADVASLLSSVKGVGPKVLESFLLLRGSIMRPQRR
jgi:3-methyladenine DNA glycosylase/8-oxoguanine DNA glycosylase